MKTPKTQRGLSLIELMIGITITLILLAGASVILVNASKSSRIQDGMIKLNEDARFAIHQITRDIEMAGYYGCAQSTNPKEGKGWIRNNIDFPATTTFIASAVSGEEGTTGTLSSPDALDIQFARPVTTLATDMTNPSAAIQINTPSGTTASSLFAPNDILIISDCDAGDLFSVSGIDGANSLLHALGTDTNIPINTSGSLGKAYIANNYLGKQTEILKLDAIRYSIGYENNDPTPILYRNTSYLGLQPFVRGVDMFEVLYGEDINNDSLPDVYVSRDKVTSITKVVAIKFALLLRTEETYGQSSDRNTQQDFTVLGQAFIDDGINVRRRLYESTVYIRNSGI